MTTISVQKGNSAKSFEELTIEQKERVVSMFAPLRPHNEYLYEIDRNGEVRCRRFNSAQKLAAASRA